jgi:hypothetical protein
MPPVMLLFVMVSIGYILGVWTACAIYQVRQAEYEEGLSRAEASMFRAPAKRRWPDRRRDF